MNDWSEIECESITDSGGHTYKDVTLYVHWDNVSSVMILSDRVLVSYAKGQTDTFLGQARDSIIAAMRRRTR